MSDTERSRSPHSRNSSRGKREGSSNVGRDTNSNDSSSIRKRVFVGNLNVDKASKEEVKEIFEKFGAIDSISLHNNFGFIQFRDNEGADEAVLKMHGETIFGKRIDCNLAGIRRKDQSKDKAEGIRKEEIVPPHMLNAGAGARPPRPRRRSRSPPREHRRRSLSPMSRYEELYRREDPYARPGPRAPFDPYDRAARDYLPPPDPYHRDPYSYDRAPPRDDLYRRSEYRPPPPRVRPPIDCEIVSLSKEESRYAEEVESRLRSIGLVCNIGYPPADIPVPEAIDRVARLGTLYAVVVAPQNAVHRSCTLNILHGTRQEHRNMPLDDCLSLVARNFDTYLKILRDPYRAPPPPASYGRRDDPIRTYQPPVATHQPVGRPDQKNLSDQQLEEMIDKLRREKEQRMMTAPPERQPELDPQRRSEIQAANGGVQAPGGYAPQPAVGGYQAQPPQAGGYSQQPYSAAPSNYQPAHQDPGQYPPQHIYNQAPYQ